MSAKTVKMISNTILALAFLLAGCQMIPTPAVVNNMAAYTEAALTIVAELTKSAPTLTATPEAPPASPTVEALPDTSTPLPTNTPLPSDTPVPTETPLPTDTPTPEFTATPTSPPEPNWAVEYKDNFSYTEGWPVGDFNSSHMRYTEKGYVIKNQTVKAAVWAVRNTAYGNVRVEVDASRRSGPLDGYYGVVCHFSNGNNYYMLAVGSDGWFGIGMQKGGKLSFLKESRDSNAVVLTGSAVNHIRADCYSGRLILWVNGVKLLEVEDSTFTGGAVGLAAGTRKVTNFEVLFDNFIVYTPE
jgi:hypothetical protein